MDEELSMAMWKTIKSVFEDGERRWINSWTSSFGSGRICWSATVDRLAIEQLRVIFQKLLDVCVAKGDEELRARGWTPKI